MSIGMIVSDVLQLYSFLIIIWCLLSWFPNIKWYDQPWKTLDMLVQPVCGPFRKVIPPINGIDLSPMLAMFLVQMAATFARSAL